MRGIFAVYLLPKKTVKISRGETDGKPESLKFHSDKSQQKKNILKAAEKGVF